MQLLIFRHGIAEDYGPDGDDDSRRLTPDGIEKTTQAARGLAALVDRPDVILTSSKTRALQTAQILGKVLGRVPVELDVLGSPSVPRIIAALGDRTEAAVMIVGHEPTLSHVAAHLCTRGAPVEFIELKKAGCLHLEVPMQSHGVLGQARLIWLATPKMLRAVEEGG